MRNSANWHEKKKRSKNKENRENELNRVWYTLAQRPICGPRGARWGCCMNETNNMKTCVYRDGVDFIAAVTRTSSKSYRFWMGIGWIGGREGLGSAAKQQRKTTRKWRLNVTLFSMLALLRQGINTKLESHSIFNRLCPWAPLHSSKAHSKQIVCARA